MKQAIRNIGIALAFAVLASGCGSGTPKVGGKVLVDGSPLPSGAVRFVPDRERGNNATTEPAGQIKSDGTYALYANGKGSIPSGWYKVTVSAAEIPDSSRPYAGRPLVAPRFNLPETSGLSVEVTSSAKAGAYDLNVSAR